jgi:hypothetical protein
MPPLARRLHCQGFTFNELLVTMNVMVIGILGLSIATVSVIRGNNGNNNFAIAVNLAHDKIEQLKTAQDLTPENRCPGGGDNAINSLGSSGGIFDRCWKIYASALGAQLKQVDVTISWRDAEPHQITLSTLIFTHEPL